MFDNATIADSLFKAYSISQKIIADRNQQIGKCSDKLDTCNIYLSDCSARNSELEWQNKNLLSEIKRKNRNIKIGILIVFLLAIAIGVK